MLDEQRLIAAAKEARRNAHAPYSDFRVGAAVLTKTGKIFAGCNVENISLRLTLCAEEVAIGSAVAAGEKEFVAVAVIADSNAPVMPCGGCRQLLAEFNPEIHLISARLDGHIESYSLAELLPRARQGILDRNNDAAE
jgi:cytidine deaminase